ALPFLPRSPSKSGMASSETLAENSGPAAIFTSIRMSSRSASAGIYHSGAQFPRFLRHDRRSVHMHHGMGPRLREAIAIVGVMVLAALGAGRAVASLPEPSNVPPFIRTPEPGIFDTLPGPPTSPRAFADR